MTKRGPADVELACRLLALEGADADAALRVHRRLAARLEPLIGVAGLRALLARSAKLTMTEFPGLASLASEPPPPLPTTEERLQSCLSVHEPEQLTAAAGALYGTMIGLLTSFIGEKLVWQVLRAAYPAIEQSVKETKP